MWWLRLKLRLVTMIDAAPFWVGGWLLLVEAVVLTSIAFVCGWRAIQFGSETDWTFRGMLHVLDQNWRGVLILAAAMFYRTGHMILSRMKTFYSTWGELTESGQEVVDVRRQQTGEPQ
jgi:hypothetical protein